MSRTFAALAHRNYRWFIAGQSVTNIGTWMQRIAQDWLVLQVTHGDAVTLGVVTAFQFLPFLVLAPVVGVVADRFDRRVVLAITGTVGALAAAGLAAAAMDGSVSTVGIYAAAAALGVAAAFDQPARQALLGQLVPRDALGNAVALNSATFNLARIIGPALAGVLIAWIGVGPVFAANAVSFLWAVGSLAFMRPREFVEGHRSAAGDAVTFRAGLRYLRQQPDLLLVLSMVGIAAIFAFNFSLTTALMSTQVFGVGAGAFGMLGATLAIGSISGSLLAARRQVRPSLRHVVAAGVGFGIATAISGLMPTYAWFAAFLPVCGFSALTFSVAAQSYLQLRASADQRGRVMGIYALVFFGSNPVGAPLLGLVAAHFGPRWCLVGGGLLAAGLLLIVTAVAARLGWLHRDGGEESEHRIAGRPAAIGAASGAHGEQFVVDPEVVVDVATEQLSDAPAKFAGNVGRTAPAPSRGSA